jgi:hypothetical protein
LDLDSGHYFIHIGDGIEDTREAFYRERTLGLLPYTNLDGSYHYYPILPDETEYDAERRIFILTARQYGIGNVWGRMECREQLAKGTWSPNFARTLLGETANATDPDSSSMPSSANEEKGVVFSISI